MNKQPLNKIKFKKEKRMGIAIKRYLLPKYTVRNLVSVEEKGYSNTIGSQFMKILHHNHHIIG